MGNLPSYPKLADAKAVCKAHENVFAIGRFGSRGNAYNQYVCLDPHKYVDTWLALYRYQQKEFEFECGNPTIPFANVDGPTPLKYLANLQTEYCNPEFVRWFCDIDCKTSCDMWEEFVEPFVAALFKVLSTLAPIVNVYVWEAHDKVFMLDDQYVWAANFKIRKASYHIHATMHNYNDYGIYEVFFPSIAAVRMICAWAVAVMIQETRPNASDAYAQNELIKKAVDHNGNPIIDTAVYIDGSRVFRVGGAFKLGQSYCITRPFWYSGTYTDGQWSVGEKLGVEAFLACIVAPSVLPIHSTVLSSGMPKRIVRNMAERTLTKNTKFYEIIRMILNIEQVEDVAQKDNNQCFEITFRNRFCWVKLQEHKSNRCEYTLYFNKLTKKLDVYCRCLDVECNSNGKFIDIGIDPEKRLQAEHLLQ